MKRHLTLLVFFIAFFGNAMAYDAVVRDDIDFTNLSDGASIQFNGNILQSINGRNYTSWLNGDPRISVDNTSGWLVWTGDNGQHCFENNTNETRQINILNLKAGDVLVVWLQKDCTIATGNTATGTQPNPNTGEEEDKVNAIGSSLSDGQNLKVVEDGTVTISLNEQYAGVRYIEVHVRHEATYTITPTSNNGNTFKFTGDGVFTDKHAAVPYLNVSFGNDNNLTYVKKINGNDYGSASVSSNNNEYTEFSNNVPNEGTYYYFFPEADGTITIKGYRDGDNSAVFFSQLNDGSFKNMYENNYNSYAEYTQRIEKGKAYYISSNAWTAGSEHPIFRLSEYTFTPDYSSRYFGPLSFVTSHGAPSVDDATQNATGLTNVAIKACLGNIESATITVQNGQLKFSAINYYTNNQYKENQNVALKTGKSANKGGAILVYMNPKYTDGVVSSYDDIFVLTVPYAAEQYADRATKQVKMWDFYSNSLTLGKSTDTNSQLYKEMHQANGKSDWTDTYLNLHKPGDDNHVFKNAYDMVGDNADMIVETEGLIFNTAPNESCIFNELDPATTAFRDRYVGLFNGGSFTIPRLEAGDFIRIKMNRYGSSSNGRSQAILKITGATDIVGNEIGEDYSIGGSAPFATSPNTPNGEYNFISTGGNFTLTVMDAAVLKLYTIEIYKNSEFVANNRVMGNGRSFLYVDDQTAQPQTINLHFRGKGESIMCLEQSGHTGTYYDDENKCGKDIVFPEDVVPEGGERGYVTSLTLNPTPGVDFGSVRLKIGCMTMNGKYVTDYDYWGFTVGYRKTQPYPYTWDFTDLSSRVMSSENGMTAEQERNPDNRVWYDYSSGQTGNYHRVGYDGMSDKGGRFAQGGQLYAGSKMILETEGLGMNMSNIAPLYNDGMRIANIGGLELNSKAGADWWRHRIEIPHVPANAVVYLRVKKLPDDEVVAGHFFAGYSYGSWVRNVNTEQDMPNTIQIFDREVAEGDEEYTYVIPGSTKSESENITIYLNGVILKKIGVSTDPKAVNSKGWTSESRNHAIDAALTSYFTGKEMKTYFAGQPDYTNRTLVLTDIGSSENNHVVPANTGCVIFNKTDEKQVDMMGTGTGFHLFVPDMHDTEKLASETIGEGESAQIINLLKPQLGLKNPMQRTETIDGVEHTVYLLAYQYYQLDQYGNAYGDPIPGDEMFYRIAGNKPMGLNANSAYLLLPTSKVKPQGALGAKYSFMFADYDDLLFNNIVTGVEGLEETGIQQANQTDWYNLNGQKLNGKPSASGIYIVNGKKLVIK